jgi:hypothetical protein
MSGLEKKGFLICQSTCLSIRLIDHVWLEKKGFQSASPLVFCKLICYVWPNQLVHHVWLEERVSDLPVPVFVHQLVPYVWL